MTSKDSDQLEKEMRIKIKLLDGHRGQVAALLVARNVRQLTRLSSQMKTKVDECYDLVSTITEMKLNEDEDEESATDWSMNASRKLQTYDDTLDDIEELLKEVKEEEANKERRKDREEEEDRRRRWRQEEENRIEKQRKFELDMEDKRMKRLTEETQKAKLPKLQISKFDGSVIDWVRFWEQFETEIDKCSSYADITKFSYLRELLSAQPKTEIAGLPFNEDGYQKAKQMLRQKYGVTSEIVHAHGQQILNLPVISSSSNLKSIHNFYRNLNVSVNSLKTLGKLDTAEILVRETLDKLGPIKADIIRTDPDWQSWKFEKLLESLREYTIRNPEKPGEVEKLDRERKPQRVKGFQAQNKEQAKICCVYCNGESHRSSECEKVKTIPERKEILKKKKLCYNCTGQNHSVASCRSRNCSKCKQRHHTSICTYQGEKPSLFMLEETKETIHPCLVAVANHQKFRVLLDTGAGSSYVSSTFVNHLKCKPAYWESKAIETMMTTTTQKLPVYNVELNSTDGRFAIDIKVNKLDRPVLTTLKNPQIAILKQKYPHLNGLKFDNEDDKAEHPIHIILGAGDIARIKASGLIAGKSGEPVAEKTLFGWTIMGHGMSDSNLAYLSTNSSQDDYRKLYSLDVLGLEDTMDGDQSVVHQEFKEKLRRGDDGKYSCELPWKENHPFLPNNKSVSLGRLRNLLRKLKETPDILQQYHDIIQGQLEEGILEVAPEELTGEKEYYMPHRVVIKPEAETTKFRIVFDASSREKSTDPSLNDCLHMGPALQPKLQNILIRNRMRPVAVLGDIKKAFHQIEVDKKDRDVFRFFWVKDLKSMEVVTLRFTRLPFGCTSSPFVLGATLVEHINSYEEESIEKEVGAEMLEDIFVDDLTTGGTSVDDAAMKKVIANKVFQEGGFTLHKWHSNIPSLEDPVTTSDGVESESYAKDFVGMKPTESKILGVHWDKRKDELGVDFATCSKLGLGEMTKRGVLKAMASVYDPLGIASPLLLTAKNIYRNVCEQRNAWDDPLTDDMKRTWLRWIRSLPGRVTVPRSLCLIDQEIHSVQLHGFGDASKQGCCSTIFVVIHYGDRTTQGLLTAKSRIAKKDLSIPRLELVAGHMVANSLDNVRKLLTTYPRVTTHAWLDSTVALYWILNNNREWKQFVSNRVEKINKKPDISWRHCPTKDNPADIGSRGTSPLPRLWYEGPDWLSEPNDWPEDIVVSSSTETEVERKLVKEIHLTATEDQNFHTELLERYSKMTRLLRVTAWMKRFVMNCKGRAVKGELSSEELQHAMDYWIAATQKDGMSFTNFQRSQQQLNLVENDKRILVCQGRISGELPIFLPSPH